jgi:hypothetical protein
MVECRNFVEFELSTSPLVGLCNSVSSKTRPRVGFMTKLLACQFTLEASSLNHSGHVAPTLQSRKTCRSWLASNVAHKLTIALYNRRKYIQLNINIERPQLMCDYPLNLSILIRGGKETKRDSQSSGERNGNSPARRVVGFTAHRPVPCKGGSIISRI